MIFAHHPHHAVGPSELWSAWHPDPTVVLALGLVAVLYGRGLRRLGTRRVPGVSRSEAAAFGLALVVLVMALASPLEAAAASLFAAHMIQHLVLMTVAAPLLVWGRPLRVMTMAFPRAMRRRLRRVGARAGVRSSVAIVTRPAVVWAVGAGVLWGWHMPVLYEAAVVDDVVHALEHASLLGTAALLWAAVLGRQRRPLTTPGAVLLLFASGLQGAALGAVLTFAQAPLYPVHGLGPSLWGLTPLEDQQLAGVLMWVPPGLVYLAVMAGLLVRWFAALDAPDGEQAARTVVGGPA